jgi:hypothetical protein
MSSARSCTKIAVGFLCLGIGKTGPVPPKGARSWPGACTRGTTGSSRQRSRMFGASDVEVRGHAISAPGLPSAPYIENIGAQPDVSADYKTVANLLSGG